jgi:hypothetical protein
LTPESEEASSQLSTQEEFFWSSNPHHEVVAEVDNETKTSSEGRSSQEGQTAIAWQTL